MTLRPAPHVEETSRDGDITVAWKDKVDKAVAARNMGKELRKGKKRSLSTSVRTRL